MTIVYHVDYLECINETGIHTVDIQRISFLIITIVKMQNTPEYKTVQPILHNIFWSHIS